LKNKMVLYPCCQGSFFIVKNIFVCHGSSIAGSRDMARKRKPDDFHPTMVRFPEGLRRDLQQSAALHGRSLNAEIIYLLNQSLYESRGSPTLAARLEGIENEVRRFARLIKAQQSVAQDALAQQKVAQDALAALKGSATKPKDDGEQK
jgi:plasmid stability protein